MLRFWYQLHKLLGLIIAAPLLLICLTGGVLVFKEDIIALNFNSNVKAPAYDVNTLASGLQTLVQRHPLENIYYLKTPTQGRDYWLLATKDEHLHLYNGSDLSPIEDRLNIQPALHWLSHLHTEILLPKSGTTWLTLLGIFTLILMLAGFIRWWPGRKGFKWQHLWCWPTRRGPALRMHRAVAIICLPLLLLSVITGGGMSIQSAIRYVSSLMEASPQQIEATADIPEFSFDASQLESMMVKAQEALPQSEITLIGLPSPQRPQLRLRFREPGEWHVNGKTNLTMDVNTGQLQIKGTQTASTGRKILNTFYPLHSSYGLPAFYKTWVAITGVLSVLLGFLGVFSWLKRAK